MEQLFLSVAERGLAAGWLVLVICALRLLLRKAPRRLLCLLWALAAFRLVCPVTLRSPVSLAPRTETVTQWVMPQSTQTLPASEAPSAPVPAEAAQPSVSPAAVLSRVWLAGAAGMLVYAGVSSVRLRRRLRFSAQQNQNVWLCDEIDTPFVLGLFAPRIYLPSALGADQAVYVLAHERAHIARGDHWWKLLGWLMLSVYWFQPLLWLGWVLFCRDLELACDERVARSLDRDGLAAYAQALLDCGTDRPRPLLTPLAFGEVGILPRVQAILHYRKPSLVIVLAAVALGILAAVFFLPDRASADFEAYFARYQSAVLAGDRDAAAKLRWFENDTKRQMYLDGFQQPERFEVVDQAEINENLRVFSCEEQLPDMPETLIYQFVGRSGGRLWIYANVNQIPEEIASGLDRSLYDYHEDENVMFADDDQRIKELEQADARTLIQAFPETDGAYTETLIARLAEYYRADPEGVTRLIEENTLTEAQRRALLEGIALVLAPADEIVTVGAARTVDCTIFPDGLARAPMLFRPESDRLTVTLLSSPVPPVVVRLYDTETSEVISFAEVEQSGEDVTFLHLSGETTYILEVVLPEGTPADSAVSLRVAG